MIVSVPKETFPDERRVALVPATVAPLVKAGLRVVIEAGAGEAAGFPDSQYVDRGATIASSRAEALGGDCILQVRTLGSDRNSNRGDWETLRSGQVVIGMADPLASSQAMRELAERGVTLFALELMPRISRAQGMDVLSSMATVAGYRAVLRAAVVLPKMFPLMMTAAGTIAAAKVLVVGAGVAGLQAIATARRLGAIVSAYDVRPVVKEQVLSLGAKFIEMGLETSAAEAKGGYAQAMDESFYRRQREMMTRIVAEHDVVITTASVAGAKAPVLITAEMVAAMAPGSVIVDLAAERGGNCEVTQPGATVVHHGVTVIGPLNLPSEAPFHASQMYAKNISTFLLHLVRQGELRIDTSDEITRDTLVSRDGQVVHQGIRELLGLGPLVVKDTIPLE